MTRAIVFLVYPDFQILDLTGPLEVFSQAERMRPDNYTTHTVALESAPATASCGIRVLTDPPAEVDRDPVDTLVVVGGPGAGPACGDPRRLA
jgi:transcriptional regulator GlxA family with amidase domain